MTKKNKYIIFILFSFLISNDYIIEFSENDSSLVQIYYNSENSIIPSYVYPVYTRIMLYDQNNDLIDDITSSMTKAYWMGNNHWVYNLSYEVSMRSVELRFAKSLENLSSEYESFRTKLVKSDINLREELRLIMKIAIDVLEILGKINKLTMKGSGESCPPTVAVANIITQNMLFGTELPFARRWKSKGARSTLRQIWFLRTDLDGRGKNVAGSRSVFPTMGRA